MASARRAVVLGLDAMVPNTLERFLGEGELPHFAELVRRGVLTRVRPVIPAQTPSNWTTIATGATPGTHGVVVWGSHIPGEPVWKVQGDAFAAGLCRAEYIWEAAARAGLRSVVMNYCGYPPTTDKATFIDWLYQPARSYFDLALPTVYHNCPELNTTDPIEPRPAEGWRGVPVSSRPPLEIELHVVPATAAEGPRYMGLLVAGGDAYNTLLICDGRDAARPLASLLVGQWSDWLHAAFDAADLGRIEGAFRFKLVEMSPDAARVRVYRSDAFATGGLHVSDPALRGRIMREMGPYVHSGMTSSLHCCGWLDFATVDELMAEEAQWWAGAAGIAMEERDASLLWLHWHDLDCMGHTFVQRVDPTGSGYDAANLEKNWAVIRDYYRAADRFVGAFVDRFDDGETAFVVVSDHGMPANRKAVSLINLFRERGWIEVGRGGVDWPRSKVFVSQNHLWIGLDGRDEGGIVPAGQYADLQADVVAAMRDLKDPDTGRHVFSFVLPRRDAAMVGLWGACIGDVVFCYEGGYRWSGGEVIGMGEKRAVFPCGGGNHGPMVCTYETETTSVMGTLVMAGSGVRSGVRLPREDQLGICTTDVAPTVAHLIGIEAPAQNEGRVLQEFVVGLHSARPARKLEPMERPIVFQKTVRPRAPKLKGDVTDEE